MFIRIGTSIDNSPSFAMTYARQFHELIFRGRIHVHKMMPATVPTLSHSLSSCLRLIRCFRSRFPDFSTRFFQRRLSTFRGFRYLVACALLAGALIGGRGTVIITTTGQTEHKNQSEKHWKVGNVLFSHTAS